MDRAPLFLLLKPASDRLALEALFKSTGGADWAEKEGWMTDAELGEWHGVTVDGPPLLPQKRPLFRLSSNLLWHRQIEA